MNYKELHRDFSDHIEKPHGEVKNQGTETLIISGNCDMTTFKPEWTFSSPLKDNLKSILMAERVFKEPFHFPVDTLVETKGRERQRSFGFFVSSLLHHPFPCALLFSVSLLERSASYRWEPMSLLILGVVPFNEQQ